MKSNIKYFILAVVACGAGYLFGAHYGLPCADESQTAGDINRTNLYKTIISNPDEQMPLIKQRLSEFVAVTNWASMELRCPSLAFLCPAPSSKGANSLKTPLDKVCSYICLRNLESTI